MRDLNDLINFHMEKRDDYGKRRFSTNFDQDVLDLFQEYYEIHRDAVELLQTIKNDTGNKYIN